MPKKLAQIFHFDSFGKRQKKYDRLTNTEFTDVEWKELEPKEPYYFFVPKDFTAEKEYNKGFSVSEIFIEFNSGIQTKNDKLSIQFDKKDLENIVLDFKNLSEEELKDKYNLKNTSGWNIMNAKNDLLNNKIIFTKIGYRPFDVRESLFTGKSSGFIGRPRTKESKNMLNNNLCLFTTRTIPANQNFNRVFVGKNISEIHIISDQTYFFPLYLYQEYSSQVGFLNEEPALEKVPNFNMKIIQKIEKKLKLKLDEDFTPEELFDYIYSVLHSKSYREKYKEFLKIDFPKVPFDVNKETFFKMVELGKELRSYHLLENENLIPKNFITKYSIDGDNLVEKIKYEDEKVFINDIQYFEGVPENIWNFYIGGYRPAQKWLKDRKGRELGYEDILHYGKMIVSLNDTVRIMEEIGGVFRV